MWNHWQVNSYAMVSYSRFTMDHKLQWPQEGLNCEPFTLIHQPAFTCSNWVMETPENCGKSILVSLLLILNRFHTLFWYFHCWLWTNKCRLRQFPDQLRLLSVINYEHGPALIWNEGSIPKIVWHFLKKTKTFFQSNFLKIRLEVKFFRQYRAWKIKYICILKFVYLSQNGG